MTNPARLIEPTDVERRRLVFFRNSTFWVLLVGYIGYYLCRGNLAVALPLLNSEFGYSNTQLATILTFSEVAYAVGKFTTGPLADKIGGKKVFLLGMIGAIFFNLAFPFFSGIFAFTIVWCFCRFFLSMGWGGIIKLIGEWYEPERNGTIMGLISINFQFGSVAASLFCGFLIAWGVGWRGLFFWPAAVVSLMAVWAIFGLREKPSAVVPGVRFGKNAGSKRALADFDRGDDERVPTVQIMRTLFSIPLFRHVLVFSFFSHFLRSVFLFWTPKLLVDIGMGVAAAAMTSAIFPLLGCLGTVFLGWYTDRYAHNGDRARMMAWMLSGLAVSLFSVGALIPFQLEYQVAIVALLGIGGFCLYGPYSMSAGCLTLDIAGPKGAGTCTGLIDGFGYIGGALAAWGAGYMSDRFGWSEVFYTLGVSGVLATAWTFFMSFSHRARHATGNPATT